MTSPKPGGGREEREEGRESDAAMDTLAFKSAEDYHKEKREKIKCYRLQMSYISMANVEVLLKDVSY